VNANLAYVIRVSLRAKRVQMKLNQFGELEIVIPQNFNQKEVVKFVERHSGWIHRTRERILSLRPKNEPSSPFIPDDIYLRAVDRHFRVVNSASSLTAGIEVDYPYQVLEVSGSQAQQLVFINQWMQKKAKKILLPWLQNVGAELSLSYNKVTIRRQKTRWGSCSAQHNINLNRNLLLLAPELVRYLIIHELCHTVHFNHSESYWQLVAQYEPNYKALDHQLNRATRTIPRWACK